MNFVLDNSIAMRWVFADGGKRDLSYAMQVLDALDAAEAVVPAIWPLEVANVLARAEARGLRSASDNDAFIERLRLMPIVIDPETASRALAATLQLSRRHRLTAYDAAYLELAMRKDLPLATLDEELAGAAKRAGVARFEAAAAR